MIARPRLSPLSASKTSAASEVRLHRLVAGKRQHPKHDRQIRILPRHRPHRHGTRRDHRQDQRIANALARRCQRKDLARNLPAVERIDGEEVHDRPAEVHKQYSSDQLLDGIRRQWMALDENVMSVDEPKWIWYRKLAGIE